MRQPPIPPTVALVGVHGHGRWHLNRIADLEQAGRLRLTAVADPRPPEPGTVPDSVARHDTLDDLLAAGPPDVTLIATPTPTHFALAEAALRAGSDVLLEKPPVTGLAELEDLRETAAANGRVVQVGSPKPVPRGHFQITERTPGGRRPALGSPAMGIAERLFGSARDRFGKEVAARVRAVDAVVRADYDPAKFQVVYQGAQGAEPAVINLETVFRETRDASAAARKDAIGRLADIAALPPSPEHWADVRSALRPVLRPVPADPKFDLVSRPAVRYLAELLVVDTPSAMQYATKSDLERWGVSAGEAFDAAHRNMARTVTTSLDEARRNAGAPRPTRFGDDGDAYLTSLPLVQGWLAAVHRIAAMRPLAFPVNNSTLLLAYETPDAEALAKAFEVAEHEWRESARPISPAPLTVDDEGNVVLYQPPADHPAHEAAKHAQILLAMDAYGPQTEYLRGVAGPEDPFPAALKGFRSPAGTEVTAASWADEETSLLPEADLVLFPKKDRDMLMVPWAVVVQEAGLTPADGYHPARYRVGGWPDPAVMERMAKLATEA